MRRIIGAWYDEFKGNMNGDLNQRVWDTASVRKYEWSNLAKVYATVLDDCRSQNAPYASPKWNNEAATSEVRE